MFRDREDAALQLSGRLMQYATLRPLILAIPRGAVPMAATIARQLRGDMDVVLVKKLRAPLNPEFALGAIDESGTAFLADYATSTGADEDYLEREKQSQLAALRARRAEYTPLREPISPRDRYVVIVDDGIATGATMLTALKAIRALDPKRLICAVPVAPPEALESLRTVADEVICLETPFDFRAVGQFYLSFPQVEDAEVKTILAAH